MILLALGVAILDEHTRLAHLESDGTPLSLLLAAIGAAACHLISFVALRYQRFTTHAPA